MGLDADHDRSRTMPIFNNPDLAGHGALLGGMASAPAGPIGAVPGALAGAAFGEHAGGRLRPASRPGHMPSRSELLGVAYPSPFPWPSTGQWLRSPRSAFRGVEQEHQSREAARGFYRDWLAEKARHPGDLPTEGAVEPLVHDPVDNRWVPNASWFDPKVPGSRKSNHPASQQNNHDPFADAHPESVWRAALAPHRQYMAEIGAADSQRNDWDALNDKLVSQGADAYSPMTTKDYGPEPSFISMPPGIVKSLFSDHRNNADRLRFNESLRQNQLHSARYDAAHERYRKPLFQMGGVMDSPFLSRGRYTPFEKLPTTAVRPDPSGMVAAPTLLPFPRGTPAVPSRASLMSRPAAPAMPKPSVAKPAMPKAPAAPKPPTVKSSARMADVRRFLELTKNRRVAADTRQPELVKP